MFLFSYYFYVILNFIISFLKIKLFSSFYQGQTIHFLSKQKLSTHSSPSCPVLVRQIRWRIPDRRWAHGFGGAGGVEQSSSGHGGYEAERQKVTPPVACFSPLGYTSSPPCHGIRSWIRGGIDAFITSALCVPVISESSLTNTPMGVPC